MRAVLGLCQSNIVVPRAGFEPETNGARASLHFTIHLDITTFHSRRPGVSHLCKRLLRQVLLHSSRLEDACLLAYDESHVLYFWVISRQCHLQKHRPRP